MPLLDTRKDSIFLKTRFGRREFLPPIMPLLTPGEFVEAFFESVFEGNLIQLFEI